MPFNRNNPADLAALKSEFELDPAGQGYRSPEDYFASGGVRELLIAVKRADAGGQTATRSSLSVEDLLEAIVANPAEYAAVVTEFAHANADVQARQRLQRERFISTMLDWFKPQITPQGPVSTPIPQRFYGELSAIFRENGTAQAPAAAAPTIRATLLAEMSGVVRREEALFGDDTELTREDVRAALAYTP